MTKKNTKKVEVKREEKRLMTVKTAKADIFSSLGEVIRRSREQRKYSQAVLAKKIGVAHNTVSDWERGIYTPKNLSSTLKALNRVFQTKEFTTRFLV